MARIRTIKPEFFTSPDTASVSHAARLLYIAMWSWADDYGRGEMNILQLRAFAFPEDDPWLDSEMERKSKEFQSLCKEVVNGFDLKVYKNKGRSFYQIPSWDSHQKTQRKASSKHPTWDDPDSTADLRFLDSLGSSEEKQGSSESKQGDIPLGTGEREQGKGNREQIKDLSDSGESDDPAPDPKPASKPKKTRHEYTPEFEEFWKVWPNARGASKFETSKKFTTALKAADAETIIAGTRRFAADPNMDPEFCPMPTTWLHNRRWEAGPLPARGQSASQQSQAPTHRFGTRPEDWGPQASPESGRVDYSAGATIIDDDEVPF